MQQRRFAGSTVSAIGLGTASWSFSPTRDDRTSESLLRLALDAGITYIDSAAAYTTATTASHNEALIARVLGAHHEGVVVATKGGHTRAGNEFPVDGRPQSIRDDCERSLAALGSDSIDLYYLHKPDPLVPFEDSVGALAGLQRDGKIKAIGLSNVSIEQVRAARQIAPIAAIQNSISPFDHTDIATATLAHDLGIAYFVYSPLGGPHRAQPLAQALPLSAALAARQQVSIEQAVLAWLLSINDTVIPIVGSSRRATLFDSIAAASVQPSEDLQRLLAHEMALLQPGA